MAAQDLYRSELFLRQSSFAKRFAREWRILSAKHGLVRPEQTIAPYDETLKAKSESERRNWASQVFSAMQKEIAPGDVIIMLAGESYSKHLTPMLRSAGAIVWEPLKNLPIGKQLQWLGRASENPDRATSHCRLYSLLASLGTNAGQGQPLRTLLPNVLPTRGVYFFVDDGEKSRFGSIARIVRVGTHAVSRASKSTLWQRLRTHRGNDDLTGSHRSSIFRLHVGAAYLASIRRILPTWGVGNQAPLDVRQQEVEIEKWVSGYIRELRVYWVGIPDAPHPQSDRSYVERGVIGLLSYGGTMEPSSEQWLGRFSVKPVIRDSGLWNLNYVGEPYPKGLSEVLSEYVRHTIERPADTNIPPIAPKDWHLSLRTATNKRQGTLL